MRALRWQNIVGMALGLWLVESPMVLNFGGSAGWGSVILGVLVISFASVALLNPSRMEGWAEIGVGLGLLVTPWAFNYESTAATSSSMITGVLVIVFAIWLMVTDREFVSWWNDRWRRLTA
jgi:SPW repeat